MSINNRMKHMFSTGSCLFIIIIHLITIFKFNHIKCDTDINPPNSWKKIEDIWPNQDRVDEINDQISEFYFINDLENQDLNWKFNKEFVKDDLKLLTDNQTIKLSFKYWSSAARSKTPPNPSIQIGQNILYSLNDRYSDNYKTSDEKFWMPFETIMSKKQLNDFQFDLSTYRNNWMAAIKDLQVEYEEEISGDGSLITNKVQTSTTTTTQSPSTALPTTDKKFPQDCYITQDIPKGFCGVNFEYLYQHKDLQNFNISVIEANLNSCFDIKVFTRIKLKINVYVNGFGDKTITKIRTLQPLISFNQKFHETEKLCLSDFSYLNSGKFHVTFEIELNKPVNFTEQFAFYLEKDDKTQPIIIPYKTQSFLTDMKNDLKNGWFDEWETDKTLNFKSKNGIGIEFTARAYSEEISAVSLLGKPWLFYNPKQFQNDFQIILNVTEQKVYNSFILKPKICTDYFHCIDAFITKFEEDGKIRTISFNFHTKVDASLIKLMIDVEYFKPSFAYKSDFYDIDFTFQLTNFGNPCDNYDCGKNGKCVIDSKKGDKIIRTKCKCDKHFNGDDYCRKDHCQLLIDQKDKKISGQDVCDNIVGYPNCISLNETFRCACDDDSNPNWNATSQNCEPVKIDSKLVKQWKVNDPDMFNLFPTGMNNYFRLKFNGILHKNLCVIISYLSTIYSNIGVTYISESNTVNSVELNYFLSQSKDGNVEICLSDLRYFYEENFFLSFSLKINNATQFNDDSFKIIDIQTNFKNDSVKVDKIQKWDINKPDGFDSIWRRLSNDIKSNKINHNIEGLAIGKDDFATITFTSNWIENNPYILNKSSESYFKLRFNDELGELVSVNKKILYHTNENNIKLSNDGKDIKIINNELIKNDKVVPFKLDNFPSDIYKYFKIVLEISMKSKKDQDATFTIGLENITIGDPCFTDFGNKAVCKSTTCEAKSPNPLDPMNKDMCKCSKDTEAGLFCQWKKLCNGDNSTLCGNYIYGMSSKDTCSQIIPNDFQCSCSNNNFEWDPKNRNCWRKKQFRTRKVSCAGGFCPFLTDFATKAIWASKEITKIDGDQKNFLPFYFTNKKDSQLSFKFNGTNTADICVTLSYRTSGKSNLSIFYDGNNPLYLANSIQDKESNSEQYLCVSDLALPPLQNFKFNLKFEQATNNELAVVRLVKKSINQTNINSPLLSALPYLEQLGLEIVDNNFTLGNQWPLRIPSKHNEWGKDKLNFKTQHFGKRQSSLLSHWIEKRTNTMFRSRISNLDTNLKFTIDFILLDNKLSESTINTTKFEGNVKEDINKKNGFDLQFTIPDQQNPFRFKIRVNYENPENSSDLVKELFTLEKIDIGDPCINDNLTINNCTERGTCTRNSTDTKGYTCVCIEEPKTKQKYYGKNCEMKNNCATPDPKNILNGNPLTGDQVCKKFQSTCTNNANSYTCKCPDKNNYWDTNENNCLTIPKCLNTKCKQFEICDESANATCICDLDYIRNTTTNNPCKKIDPCSSIHRQLIDPQDTRDRCPNPNSFCQQISWGKNADWDCLCPEGYEKTEEKESTICSSIACKNKWMNKCQQKCEANPVNKGELFKCSCFDGYILEGKYNCKLNASHPTTCSNCTSKDKYCDPTDSVCKCNPGLKTETDNTCSLIIDKDLCPTGNLTKDSDGFEYCKCGPDYHLNKQSLICELDPICAQNGRGRKICDKQNAICVLKVDKPEMFECECLTQLGQIKDKNIGCMSKCDYVDPKDKISGIEKCAEINAKCNPYSKDLCECYQGFVKNKQGICAAIEYSSKFTLNFKDDFKFLNCEKNAISIKIDTSLFKNNFNILLNDSIEANKINQIKSDVIKSQMRLKCLSGELFNVINNYISKSNYDSTHQLENSCVKQNKSEYIACTFSLVFNNEKERNNSILTNLKNACISSDTDNCFIPFIQTTPKPYSLEVSAKPQTKYLILTKKSVENSDLKNIHGCDENNHQGHCDCIPSGDTALHSCICNPTYFTVESESNLLTYKHTKKPLKIQKCQERNDICPKTCTQVGNSCIQEAIQTPQKTGNWTVHYACKCGGTLRFNGTQCSDSCNEIQCKNGKKSNSNGVCQCVCDEKFYGVACDTEYSAGKGGWIAGIVVLAVLVVILAGVAFMFARRSRNNSSEYSGRPMDEFTGSSYRVPTNQSRAQQNPAFTRD